MLQPDNSAIIVVDNMRFAADGFEIVEDADAAAADGDEGDNDAAVAHVAVVVGGD